jgi:RNA polymerase sigma factor (sigma-70 family)
VPAAKALGVLLRDKFLPRTKQTRPLICYIDVETIVTNEGVFLVQGEDKALVRRLNRGDGTALAAVYERYRTDLLRLAVSLLGDAALGEDIVQDVFVRFAGLARTFRLTGSLKGYLATCVANAARNVLKAGRRRQGSGLDESLGLAADGDGPDRWLISSEQFTLVRRALGELPAEQREAVTLHLYGELPFREIAEWQNTSVKTVQSRYQYGLNKLRSLLDGEVAL